MKLNKIVILCIFLLAIFLAGSVSAEDSNATLTDEDIASDINVTFPEKVYEEDHATIDVSLPENANGSLKATVDDVEIYHENVTDKSVKIPITIPKSKLPYLVVNKMTDHTSHNINVFYNEILLNSSHTLKVMKFKPDHDYGFGIDEILKDDTSGYQHPVVVFPESANGTLEVYVDGNLSEILKTHTFTALNITKLNSIDLGNHTLRFIYSGDDYYLPSDRSFNFTVVDMLIQIPKNIVLEHDDCLTAKTIINTDGKLSVYFDGELVLSGKLDKNGEFLESLMKYVKCGNHTIEVQYKAGNFTKSKKVISNISYYVDIWGWGMRYGDENEVIITVPTDFNKKLINITVDGVPYTGFTIDNSGWIEVDVSKLQAGNHTLNFDFKGDEKYFSWSESYNFTVYYGISAPDDYVDRYSEVSLALPANAKGSLEVYVDNKLYKSQKLVKGKATIKLSDLTSGDHELVAKYTGNDYNISQTNNTVYVQPKAKINANNLCIYYTDNGKYTVKVTRGGKAVEYAYVTFKIAKKTYHVYANKKGVATLKLPKLAPGKYTISAIFDGVKVSKKVTVKHVLALKTVKVKKSAKKLVLTATLKKGKKAIGGKYVKFYFKGKFIKKVKTNKKGIAKVTIKKSVLKKLKVGKKVTYRVTYAKDAVKKSAKVKR